MSLLGVPDVPGRCACGEYVVGEGWTTAEGRHHCAIECDPPKAPEPLAQAGAPSR